MRVTHKKQRAARCPPRAVVRSSRPGAVSGACHHAHNMLSDLHAAIPLGVVHRDVSPQNVLLGSEGQVKITDFGIAAAKNKLTMTTPGTLLGKSAYMSPEQAKGETVDGRCDVWAVGVILHEMLTSKRLFLAEDDHATINNVFSLEVPAPSSVKNEVPAELDAYVARALQRDKNRRYPSADVMLGDLERFLDANPYSSHDLSVLLADVAWTDSTVSVRPVLKRAERAQVSAEADTVRQGARPSNDVEIQSLVVRYYNAPDLWTLVNLGERYAALDNNDEALACFRCAAAVFAHRGLLVQAICAYYGAKRLLPPEEAFEDLVKLGDMNPGDPNELEQVVRNFGADQYWEVLKGGEIEGWEHLSDADTRRVTKTREPTPLFGHLAPREFARLADAVKLHRLPVGEVVLREGDAGESLFAVGHGRLVVYCRPADEPGARPDLFRPSETDEMPSEASEDQPRVYLSALADGDYFGEFSFLTQRPRSASVEAITACRVLEIRHDEIFEVEPGFTEPLLRFYKERVVELMMAKSPVFSLLRPGDRRELLEKAQLLEQPDQSILVEEGERNDSLFFIKRGEVEVFHRDEQGVPIFINKLEQGEFFGEIAAITGESRTVSVRAMGDVSVFRIRRDDLVRILNKEPRLKKLFEDTIKSRTKQTKDAITEYEKILYGI